MLSVLNFWLGLRLGLGIIDLALASCTYGLVNIHRYKNEQIWWRQNPSVDGRPVPSKGVSWDLARPL